MTKIQITADGTTVTATIEDNATSRAFVALLPLTLELEDFHQAEKISDLPDRLPTDGAADGYSPSAGDISYYAPWGNLAIFYHDFGYSKGLVRLGHADAGIELFRKPGSVTATIERDSQQD
ncbi:cyclophilin-like fold protein [Microbulbifer zhoushanensis]|uniref:cyclophilin-like fold protein n=1 Tax=Microbulbifer TaxID=48073 RepID=UPI001EED0ACB|nr:cyclophilin-like fold protein [Microbulbifer zhoushanensis]